MAYITLEEAKAYLGIGEDDTDDDELLEGQLIPAVQSWIDSHCNRVFEADADTDRPFSASHDVEGLTLYLDADLAQIASITNGDGNTLPNGSYTYEPRSGGPIYAIHLKAGSGLVWTWDDDPDDAITVRGRWAYSIGPPDIVKQAARRLVHFAYKQKDTGTGGNDSGVTRTSPDGVVIFPTAMPKDVIAMLKPLRRL
jgi:hypothetical protein